MIDSKLLTMPEDVKSSADCPPQEYYVSGSSSTSRGRYHTLNISIGIFPPYDLNYQVLDCPGAFGISTTEMIPDTHLRPTGRVLDSVTLGGVTYTNVYTEEADTLGTIYVQPSSVWKTYYNKQYGVLGFEDRQTRSLFYRE